MEEQAPAAEEGSDKVVVEEVLDVEKDWGVIQTWYDQAGQVVDYEGLQKVLEARLGDVAYTQATTPHAYASIALAALKLANKSKHGRLDSAQWEAVLEIIGQATRN